MSIHCHRALSILSGSLQESTHEFLTIKLLNPLLVNPHIRLFATINLKFAPSLTWRGFYLLLANKLVGGHSSFG